MNILAEAGSCDTIKECIKQFVVQGIRINQKDPLCPALEELFLKIHYVQDVKILHSCGFPI